MAGEPTQLCFWNVLATVLSAVMGRVIASLECEDKQISLSAKLVPSTTYPPLLWEDPPDHPPTLKTAPRYDCCAPLVTHDCHPWIPGEEGWFEQLRSSGGDNAKTNQFKNSEQTRKQTRH